MTGSDVLLTLAQLSLGLAGFTGVVLAFRQHGVEAWPEQERVRFSYMLELAAYSILFELLPFLLHHLGLAEPTVWRVCSGLLALWFVSRIVLTQRISLSVRSRLNRAWFLTYQWGSATFALLAAGNALALAGPPGFGLYLAGLGWMLFYSASLYVRLVLTPLPRDD